MEFNSLNEIKEEFGIESEEVDSVKKELKKLIKDIHPDKNNGEFKNKLDKKNYHNIQSALDFLEKGFEVVSRVELHALMKSINDLAPISTKQELEAKRIST